MARPLRKKKTICYSNEFKVKAVLLSLAENVTVVEVARALDIHPNMLSKWRKYYREGLIVVKKKDQLDEFKHIADELEENRKLKEENHRLKQENELLKKWHRFLGELKERNTNSFPETEN